MLTELTGFYELWFTMIFFLVWASLYQILVADFDYRPEYACRLVTVVHGLLVTILAGIAWKLGPNPFFETSDGNTFSQKFAMSVSLGYFMFDMCWCIIHQTEGYTMIAHHIISLVVLSRTLTRDKGGAEACVGLFCLEITNPFLQLRWFVRSAGFKDTYYFIFVESTFISLYIFFRLGVGTILLLSILSNPYADLETKLSAITLYGLSWVFMIFIIRYVFLKYILRSALPRTRSVLPTKTSGIGDRISISAPNTSTNNPGPSGLRGRGQSASYSDTSTRQSSKNR